MEERDAPLCCETETPRGNKIYDVIIKELDLGYIVKVGCQSFAIESKSKLLTLLTEYLSDPKATEKKWNEGVLK